MMNTIDQIWPYFLHQKFQREKVFFSYKIFLKYLKISTNELYMYRKTQI